jgi:uncharacterized RDD family membrane protein YckC
MPSDWKPPAGWQPDPSWPAAPPGWQFWVSDDNPPAEAAGPSQQQTAPRQDDPEFAASIAAESVGPAFGLAAPGGPVTAQMPRAGGGVAPMGRRFAALAIDAVVVGVGFLLLVAMGVIGIKIVGAVGQPVLALMLTLAACLATVMGMAVWFTDGQTIGKSLMGLTELRIKGRSLSGGPGDLVWALARHSWGYLVVDVLGVGVLAALFSRRRHCWHDVAFASEVVVDPAASRSIEQRGRAFSERLDAGRRRSRERYGWLSRIWDWLAPLIRAVSVVVFTVFGLAVALKIFSSLSAGPGPGVGTAAPASTASTGAASTGAASTGAAGSAVGSGPMAAVWAVTAVATTTVVSILSMVLSQPDLSSINVVVTWQKVDRPETREIRIMHADGSAMHVLTSNDAADSSPDLFHDDRIVFVSERDGDPEIYAMKADGTEQTRLTTSPGADLCPHWSPDGLRIAFASDRTGVRQIFVMDADGGDPRQLTQRGGSECPDWSPDGSRIVYSSYAEGDPVLRVLDVDGSGDHPLTRDGYDRSPAWSPTGDLIAFQRGSDGTEDIYVVDADGSSPHRLTTDPSSDYGPVWAPDGDRILFSSHRGFTTGAGEYWVTRSDGADLEKITHWND